MRTDHKRDPRQPWRSRSDHAHHRTHRIRAGESRRRREPGNRPGRALRRAAADCRSRRMSFAPIPELLEELRAGRMVVVVDDEHRENEGDLNMAAALVKPSDIKFMITHTQTMVCFALPPERCPPPGRA